MALALNIAVHIPLENVVIRLLQMGADIMYIPENSLFSETSWRYLLRASGPISISFFQTVLSYHPKIDENIFAVVVMRGNMNLVQALFRYSVDKGVFTFEMWRSGLRMSVQLGFDEITQWLMDNYNGAAEDSSAMFFEFLSLIKIACTIGLNETVKLLMKVCPFIHPSIIEHCTVRGHAGALKAMISGPLTNPPTVSDCFQAHYTAIDRGFPAAAEIFSYFAVKSVDVKELLDFIITGDRTYIAYAETKCGHVPSLLYPLLFDEDMTAKCNEFLSGLDRRRFQLFISNCGHDIVRVPQFGFFECDAAAEEFNCDLYFLLFEGPEICDLLW